VFIALQAAYKYPYFGQEQVRRLKIMQFVLVRCWRQIRIGKVLC